MPSRKNFYRRNMTTNKAIHALSLARRAGKLSIGYQATQHALISGRASLVVAARDISERTLNKAKKVGSGVLFVNAIFDQNEIQTVLGRRFAIAAVTDRNFSDLFIKAYEDGSLPEEEIYDN